MRRARRIVNEMEFRMWREAKSFSPPAPTGTMKGFPPMHRLAEGGAALAPASFLRSFADAHRTFSKAARR
jgi:hypothetical protein